jgi:DNA-binding MarR family transcriptional regulator
LRDFYPYRFSVLSNTISAHIANAYVPFGISIPQWRILAVLAEFPGLTATEIATQTAMDKVAITRGVQALMTSEYIGREASKHDGRYSHLRLTAKGRGLYRKIIPKARGYERELLSHLTRKEVTALDTILHKLSAYCAQKKGA